MEGGGLHKHTSLCRLQKSLTETCWRMSPVNSSFPPITQGISSTQPFIADRALEGGREGGRGEGGGGEGEGEGEGEGGRERGREGGREAAEHSIKL